MRSRRDSSAGSPLSSKGGGGSGGGATVLSRTELTLHEVQVCCIGGLVFVFLIG